MSDIAVRHCATEGYWWAGDRIDEAVATGDSRAELEALLGEEGVTNDEVAPDLSPCSCGEPACDALDR